MSPGSLTIQGNPPKVFQPSAGRNTRIRIICAVGNAGRATRPDFGILRILLALSVVLGHPGARFAELSYPVHLIHWIVIVAHGGIVAAWPARMQIPVCAAGACGSAPPQRPQPGAF
ncbi:MAG: hypothetical protein K1X51_10175 [Rhodospirillaceae bacterium]|nr:hypothetical protein [Rhodospirillaceae bacterium]